MLQTNRIALPRTVGEISADWMTAALSRKYPGIVVKSVAIRDVIKGACTKVRIALETNQPDFPKTVMMKAGFEPHSPDMGVMHEREHLSYSDLVPTLDVETATLHFSDVAEDGRALVILEDLCLRDVTFMSLQAPIGFDLARRFLTQMAGMHARWWEADGLKARFAVASGSPSDGVALLGRATSPPCATLLAEKLPDAIPAVQSNVIWL